jgi:hypothetical protein
MAATTGIGCLPPSLYVSGIFLQEPRFPHKLGGFSDVYRGTLDGRDVAVKRIRIHASGRQRQAAIRVSSHVMGSVYRGLSDIDETRCNFSALLQGGSCLVSPQASKCSTIPGN